MRWSDLPQEVLFEIMYPFLPLRLAKLWLATLFQHQTGANTLLVAYYVAVFEKMAGDVQEYYRNNGVAIDQGLLQIQQTLLKTLVRGGNPNETHVQLRRLVGLGMKARQIWETKVKPVDPSDFKYAYTIVLRLVLGPEEEETVGHLSSLAHFIILAAADLSEIPRV